MLLLEQLIQAAILGVIQGLTEFLPVSSSAHLLIMREVFGWTLLGDDHWNTIFDVSAHVGTFAALGWYFWSDVMRLLRAAVTASPRDAQQAFDRRLAWIILAATIPIALAGWQGESAIETIFRRQPLLTAFLLMLFGFVLWGADIRGGKTRELAAVGWLDGILIGCAQTLSLCPGVSRSGITMTTGLLRGLTRETAARFAFLLSLPAIGGAAVYGLKDVVGQAGSLPPGALASFGVGLLTAAVSGYLCIRYFLRYLQTKSFAPFIWYRIALGVFLITWFTLR